MKAFVKDANLLIDLIEGGIADHWFGLGYEVYTSSLVLTEILKDSQRRLVENCLTAGLLKVIDIAGDRWNEAAALASDWGVSVPDASVAMLARDLDAVLLTGDGRLRTKSKSADMEVRGTLWVFDHLIEIEVLSCRQAAEALRRILSTGSFLPRAECEERLDRWGR